MQKRFKVFFIALAAISLCCISACNNQAPTQSRQTPFERVVSRGELHVGYLVLPPYFTKDARDGNLGGIFFDVVEELGKRLNLKIVWAEEVNLATMSTGLENGRYDMIGFPLWRSASRAKEVAFSTPLFFTPVGVYVGAADHRFDNDLGKINSPDTKISGIDGELAIAIAKERFPKAQIVALPQMADYSQMLLDVASGKADVTFFNRVLGDRFVKRNPSKIRDVSGNRPIRVFAECFVLPIGDEKFISMINTTALEMIENGVVDAIFEKYGENPQDYYRPALPYRLPEQ